MKSRWCEIIPGEHTTVKAGVPQGDPLSSLLFCLAIEPVIQKLKAKGYEIVAYCDDMMVGHRNEIQSR